MIKRPYQSMSFNGSSGHRPSSGGGSSFGGGKPWERGGQGGGFRGGDRGDRRSGGFGGGRSGGFGGGRSSGGDREMHNATCASCGNACQVPFVPNGSKPIYCSNCFKKDDSAPRSYDRPSFGGDRGGDRFGGERSHDSFNSRDSRDGGFPEKRMFKAECAKCHSECEVPFRPNGEKPVYCRACFGQSEVGAKSAAASDVSMHKLNEQFKLLNAKLDLIIEAIGIGEDEDEEEGDDIYEDEEEIDGASLDAADEPVVEATADKKE